MLRRCSINAMRMAKSRRPKERAWEVLNQRNFGQREGSQNYRTWALYFVVIISIGLYEVYSQWSRLVDRGDTCEACEATRARFRARLQQHQQQMGAQ